MAFAGLTVLISIASIAVVDVTRSMAYLLPAGLAALAIVHRLAEPKLLRHAVHTAFAVTLIWPLYYAGGSKTVYWQYPLPLVLVGQVVGIG